MSYCLILLAMRAEQAAARCKLCIEAFETSAELSAGSVPDPRNGGARAADTNERQQRLVERYSVLIEAMMEWGVEVSRDGRSVMSQTYVQQRRPPCSGHLGRGAHPFC